MRASTGRDAVLASWHRPSVTTGSTLLNSRGCAAATVPRLSSTLLTRAGSDDVTAASRQPSIGGSAAASSVATALSCFFSAPFSAVDSCSAHAASMSESAASAAPLTSPDGVLRPASRSDVAGLPMVDQPRGSTSVGAMWRITVRAASCADGTPDAHAARTNSMSCGQEPSVRLSRPMRPTVSQILRRRRGALSAVRASRSFALMASRHSETIKERCKSISGSRRRRSTAESSRTSGAAAGLASVTASCIESCAGADSWSASSACSANLRAALSAESRAVRSIGPDIVVFRREGARPRGARNRVGQVKSNQVKSLDLT